MSMEQLEALLDRVREMRAGPRPSLAEARVAWDKMASAFVPEDVRFDQLQIASIAVEEAQGPARDSAGGDIFVYLHGGGYVSGSPTTHRRLTAEISRRFSGRVLSIDYRLAPENPFPAGLDDVVAVLSALRPSARRLVLAGDSAGGGLAIASMLAMRDRGNSLPDLAWVISPWADLARSVTAEARGLADPILDHVQLAESALDYAAGTTLDHPLISPAYADFHGLPPLLIQVGGRESLVHDSLLIARQAALGGVDVTLRVWPGMVHSWVAMAGLVDEALEAIAEAVTWIHAPQASGPQ